MCCGNSKHHSSAVYISHFCSMMEKSGALGMEVSEEIGSKGVEDLDGVEKEGLIVHIPEELLEAILSKVSYPSLFKARLLCRSWYAKFLRSASNSFQNKVSAAATRWPTYCPVSAFGKELVGYDGSSKRWHAHKLALHDRVPLDLYASALSSWRLAFAGSLMCALGRSTDGSLQVLVANILSGEWRSLPCPPEIRGQPIQDFRFVRVDSHNYKVLVHNLPCRQFQAHIYDSSRNFRSWTSLSSSAATAAGIPGLSAFSAYADAYIDGSFYCISRSSLGGMTLWKFTTETAVWQEVLHSVEFNGEEFPGGLFQCASKFLVITLLQASSIPRAANEQSCNCLAARVYGLNLHSLKLTKISRSPPDLVVGTQTVTLVTDAECVYFCDIPDRGPASFSSFNVKENSWSSLPSPPPQYTWKWGRISTFEPGLSPFASP